MEEKKLNAHYRALFINANSKVDITSQHKIKWIEKYKKNNNRIGYFEVKSLEIPPKNFTDLVPLANGVNIYRIYILAYYWKNSGIYVLACPIKSLFDKILPNKGITYGSFDLNSIGNDQFNGPSNPSIKITRLNLKLFGDKDNRVKTMVLYGEDVLSSPILKGVIISDQTKKYNGKIFFPQLNLYNSEELLNIRRTEINSCRLKWDDGSGSPFALNIDKFGNINFYLKTIDKLFDMQHLLEYAQLNIALKTDITVDPLKRSETALTHISHPDES